MWKDYIRTAMKRVPALLITALIATSMNFQAFAAEEITDSGTVNEANVVDPEATEASTASFTVKIPKRVILNGNRGETNEAGYGVTVIPNGESDGWVVAIEPAESFTLSSIGKDDIEATVTQESTIWGGDDWISSGTEGVTKSGKVSVSNLSSGEWNGEFYFNITISQPEATVMMLSIATSSNATPAELESLLVEVEDAYYLNQELQEELEYAEQERDDLRAEIQELENGSEASDSNATSDEVELINDIATPSDATKVEAEESLTPDYASMKYEELLEALEDLEKQNERLQRKNDKVYDEIDELYAKLSLLESAGGGVTESVVPSLDNTVAQEQQTGASESSSSSGTEAEDVSESIVDSGTNNSTDNTVSESVSNSTEIETGSTEAESEADNTEVGNTETEMGAETENNTTEENNTTDSSTGASENETGQETADTSTEPEAGTADEISSAEENSTTESSGETSEVVEESGITENSIADNTEDSTNTTEEGADAGSSSSNTESSNESVSSEEPVATDDVAIE